MIKNEQAVNSQWINKLKEIISIGNISNPKGMKIKEIINS